MKPRSTEFYSDAYAYAVGYREGRNFKSYDFPDTDLFSDHHQQLYCDGAEQGKRDRELYDDHKKTRQFKAG